jgi:hypothetical protein
MTIKRRDYNNEQARNGEQLRKVGIIINGN